MSPTKPSKRPLEEEEGPEEIRVSRQPLHRPSTKLAPLSPYTGFTGVKKRIASTAVLEKIECIALTTPPASTQVEESSPSQEDTTESSQEDAESSSREDTDDSDQELTSSETIPCITTLTTVYDTIVEYTAHHIPTELDKYWNQRYRLWSRYDEGIWMDYEGWFSVTPEVIAKHISERCSSGVIIDAFCGVGGNTIQFAMTCERVIAIDIDPVRLACARQNARIYGVEDRIDFILGNFLELAPSLKADVVFLSPPWGGPQYLSADSFNIQSMIPMDGVKLFNTTRQITENIAYFLPRNTGLEQLGLLAGEGYTCEVEEARVFRKTKAITAYYGDLVDCPEE